MNHEEVVKRALELSDGQRVSVTSQWRDRSKRALTVIAGSVCVVKGCENSRDGREVLYCADCRADHPEDAMVFPRALLGWVAGVSPEEMILFKGPTSLSAMALEELIKEYGEYADARSGVVVSDGDDGWEGDGPGTLTEDDVRLSLVPNSMSIKVGVHGEDIGDYRCSDDLTEWRPSRSLRALYGCLPLTVHGWGQQYTPKLRAEIVRRVVEGDKRR